MRCRPSGLDPATRACLRLPLLLIPALCAVGTAAVVRAQTLDKVVAVVNDRRITQGEVDETIAAQLLPLQQQIYALRKAALENLILRAVLEDEAGRRGVSVGELRRQLTDVKVEVLLSQVEREYVENAAAFGSASPDEVREKLRLDLEGRARMQKYREALLKLREKFSVEFLLEEPKRPSVAGGVTAPSVGPEGAAVTVTEFSDFQCHYCRGAQDTIRQILKDYGRDVRLVFKHLPLSIHPQAFASAQASFCAGEQGFFWQYHDALFASDDLSPRALNRRASDLGLNATEFQSCLNSEHSRLAVLKDMQEARRLGVEGTPTFIIDGTLVHGAPTLEAFRTIIEGRLKAARPTPSDR